DPMTETPFVVSGQFGANVAAADLDGDTYADILVGREERPVEPGRAHLFYGSYIRSQVPASGGALIVPHTTTDTAVGYPGQYQTLTDPDTAAVGFGWQVYMFKKDLGEPPGVGTGDALDSWNDIAVESEGANYLDPTDHHVVTTEVGALFVYFNGA